MVGGRFPESIMKKVDEYSPKSQHTSSGQCLKEEK